LLIYSLIPCIDKKSLVFKILIVIEEIFVFKEFVVVYFMRNIYTYIEFGGL